MNAAVIYWSALVPLAIVLGGGVVSTLLEAFLPRKVRRPVQVVFALAVLVSAIIALTWRWTQAQVDGKVATAPLSIVQYGSSYAGVSFVEDAFALLGQGIILLGALLAFFLIVDRTQNREGFFAASAAARPGSSEERESTVAKREQTEIIPLALFATGGMMAFTAAFDLLALFIALEVLSLPLYVLAATARRRRLLSQEAAMKYFVLGAFSSAIFLMGAALIYGATGTLVYGNIFNTANALISAQTPLMLLAGAVMVVIGLLFKVGAAPFHAWTPDVYQGAPTPVTAFMAAGTKAAAFVALIRVMIYLAGPVADKLNAFFWIVIIATIVVGTVMGLVQQNVKRLLAFSSIAHAGFILIAINAIRVANMEVTNYVVTVSAILCYLLAYSIATIGAFAVAMLVRETDSEGNVQGEASNLAQWAGLGKRSPFLAVAMLVFLLSFAGIPLTAGFIGKFEVFRAGIVAGEVILVVLAILASVATAFFYFRLVQLMFFQEPAENTTVIASEGLASITIGVSLLLTLVIGIYPDPVLELIRGAFL